MSRIGIAVCLFLVVNGTLRAGPAEEHPLKPLLAYAERRNPQIDSTIRDYTCLLVQRERIDGRLEKPRYMSVKLRHEQIGDGEVAVPFSVYLHYLWPEELRGREVVYVRGRNRGKLIAHKGGNRFSFVTVAIDPEGDLAMRDNRYPVTAMGIRNLIDRLLDVAREELQYDEIEVKYYAGAKINGRVCTVIEVTHPVRRDYFRYHLARIFIDDELALPIRYASYDWPEEENGQPPLLEEYTYLNLELNAGLSDGDFDHKNPSYGFRKDFEP